MATEQHLFRVLGQFDPGNSQAEVQRFVETISSEINRLAGQQLKVGRIDPSEVQAIQTQLREAIAAGAGSNNAFRGFSEQLRGEFLKANGTFGKFLTEQLGVFTRSIDLAEATAYQRASRNKSGTAYVKEGDLTGDFGKGKNLYRVQAFDPAEATQGDINQIQTQADKKLAQATGAYNAALGRRDAAIEREVRAHQNAAAATEKATRQSEIQRGKDITALEARRQAEQRAALSAARLQAQVQSRLGLPQRLELDPTFLRQQQIRAAFGAAGGIPTNLLGAKGLLGPLPKGDPFGLQATLKEAADARQKQQVLQQFHDSRALPFANPNTATAIGRAQEQANQAFLAQARASRALAEEQAKAVPNLKALESAWNQERRAGEALAAAQKRIEILSAPKPQGFFQQFHAGFRGQGDLPYAQQIGQAFKFSVFYGTAYKLLFAFTQTLQQTLQEGIEFQTAVSELKLATGQSADAATDLANQLGQIATDAGFAPSQGALAGARSVGLYGATDADRATQNTVARISTEVASKLAFNSGMQIQDVQTTLAAITNAFKLGYGDQGRVSDIDAYLGKRFGVAPGQTVQAVAESGSVAQQAGFSLEQTNAIAALLMGRTGQSASAVAGWMAQIFSRGGEGSLQNVASRYGVDTTQTLERQIAELAQVYKNATPNEQNEIAAAFGRGKVQNAVSVLLGSFDEVSRAADDAAKGLADGASDKAFGERINNIGGQLQLLLADFQAFAKELGQSGVLATLGLVVEGLDQLLKSATNLLKVWNQMPEAVRAVLASLALLAVANRTQAGQSLTASLISRGGGVPILRGPEGKTLAGVAASGGTAQSLLSGTGVKAIAGGIGSTIISAGPWIAATGGLIALGNLAGAATDLRDEMRKTIDLLNAGTSDLNTPDQWQASAEELRKRAKEDTVSGPWRNVANFLLGGDISDTERRHDAALYDEASFREERAKALANRPPEFEATLLPLDQQGLADGLEAMTKAGATAQERFDALRASLLGTGEAADRARAAFDPDKLAADVATGVQVGFSGEGAPLAATKTDRGDLVFDLTNSLPGGEVNRIYAGPQEGYDSKGLQDRIRKALAAAKVDSENLTPEQMEEIAKSVVADIPDSAIVDEQGNPVKGKEALKGYRQHLTNLLIVQLSKQTEDVRDLLKENRKLLPEEMNTALAGLLQEAQGKIALLPESDLDGIAVVWRDTVKSIRAAIRKQRRHGAPITPQDLANLQTAEKALVDAEISRLENLRIAAQQQVLGDRAAVERVGKSFFQREVRLAISHGKAGADALVNLVKTAGEWGQRAALGVINQMMKAIQEIILAAASTQTSIKGKLNYVGSSDEVKKLEDLAGMKFDIFNVPHGDDETDPYTTGSDVPGYEPPDKKEKESADERRQKLLSIRSSLRHLAANLNDPLAEARLAVADALDQVKFATDRESRLAAQVQLKEARHELDQLRRQMMLSIRSSLRLLAIDLSNPLAEARVAVADALDRVRNAVNREERLAAKVDLRRARIDLEAQKFSQRLQAVQTAEELGRISHLKYISYLEHEKQRLESVKKRTYQQQQQLDEVERLLKGAADSLQGQWNFGDIKLPTPYEVRRRVEELYGGRGSNVGYAGVQGAPTDLLPRGSSSVQNVAIHINGADVAKVRQVVSEYIGSTTTTRTTTPRYR